jgi:methyltransferase (TIGR00027 family)
VLVLQGTNLIEVKANTASRTAQYMALYRAMETQRPRSKRLFTDPYAIHFLDRGYRWLCRAASFPPAERLFYHIIQRRIPGSLASGLARTRYIDDLLEQAIRQGARQVILLGAGFDTRGLRLGCLKRLPIIEIDHPDTARRKLEILGKISPGSPQSGDPETSVSQSQCIRYIQLDFNRQDLDSLLRENLIDSRIPTAIIWEGVSNYLQQEAIDKTFAFSAKFPRGSFLLFTYIDKKVLEDPSSYFGAQRLLGDLDEIGEKWTFGFRPEELPAYLRSFSFLLLEDMGAADYRERYLPERNSILQGYEFYRVAFAEKTGE